MTCSTRVELLLLDIERSQLKWFGHLIKMPLGCLHLEVFQGGPTGRRTGPEFAAGVAGMHCCAEEHLDLPC